MLLANRLVPKLLVLQEDIDAAARARRAENMRLAPKSSGNRATGREHCHLIEELKGSDALSRQIAL